MLGVGDNVNVFRLLVAGNCGWLVAEFRIIRVPDRGDTPDEAMGEHPMIPVRLSHTRYNDIHCPWRYQQVNLRGVLERVESFTQDGRLGHQIIAAYINELSRIKRKRASKLFIRVFEDHTDRISEAAANRLGEVLGNFMEEFKIEEDVAVNLTEFEMAVDRDGNPMEMSDAVQKDGTALVDCYTGIADYAGIIHGGRRARLRDHKLGHQDYDFNEITTPIITRRYTDEQGYPLFDSSGNLQMAGYAYLLFMTFPDLEEIAATLDAPKFRRRADGGFQRDTLIPAYRDILSAMWERVDAIRADGRWPATAHYRAACGFCRLAGCPAKAKLLAAKESE